MRKLITFLIILLLTACNTSKDGIKIRIENKSDSTVTNVKVTTSENLASVYFDKIAPQQSAYEFLSMKDNQSDGCYTIEFINANQIKETYSAGYYTNGGSLNSQITFEIKKDTTLSTLRTKY